MRSVGDMRKHVADLCERHNILCSPSYGRHAYAIREVQEICIPPIKSPVSYATAMHEIGHILGHHQNSKRVLTREHWAWDWARSNALFWTAAMERSRTRSVDWYIPRATKIDGAPRRRCARVVAGIPK